MAYPKQDNKAIKAAFKISSAFATDSMIPVDGLTNEDWTGQWQEAFDARMRELGWEYTGDHCMCDDPDYGHDACCGYTKKAAVCS